MDKVKQICLSCLLYLSRISCNLPDDVISKTMKTLMRENPGNYFQAIFRVLVLSSVITTGNLNSYAQCNNNWSGTAPSITFQLSGTAIANFSISFTNVGCFSSIGFTFTAITLSGGSFTQSINAYPNSGTVTGVLSADGNSMSGTYSVNLAYLHPVYFYPVSCGTITGNWSAVPETPRPVANAGPDVSVNYGQSVTLTASGGASYVWSGGITNGVAFVATETKTYTVTATATNGCTDTDDVIVTVSPSTSVFDNYEGSGKRARIYPNPASDEFTVSILNPEPEVSICLFSANGKVVFSKEYNCDNAIIFSEKIHPGVLTSGIYYVRINNRQKSSTYKLIFK